MTEYTTNEDLTNQIKLAYQLMYNLQEPSPSIKDSNFIDKKFFIKETNSIDKINKTSHELLPEFCNHTMKI